MADIFVMRPHDAVLCSCGTEVTPRVEYVPDPSDAVRHQVLCTTCRDTEEAERLHASREALTELVAHERGYALHRRRLPGTGATIDHLFVGATGVFVIDAVHSPVAEVSVERTRNRFTSPTETLTIGTQPATELVDAVHAQCAEVATRLADLGQGDVPVTPMLYFVEAHLPRRAKRRRFGDVRLTAPTTLVEEVSAGGPLDADRRFAVAMSLVSFLPSPA